MLLKKSIPYFMNIIYKGIFLNFGVISCVIISTAHLLVWPSVYIYINFTWGSLTLTENEITIINRFDLRTR